MSKIAELSGEILRDAYARLFRVLGHTSGPDGCAKCSRSEQPEPPVSCEGMADGLPDEGGSQ